MKQFTLLFKSKTAPEPEIDPAQLQQLVQSMSKWLSQLDGDKKIVNRGSRLAANEVRTVKPGNMVIDGPHTEIKEYVCGYITIETRTIDEAAEIAKGCPLLQNNGSVEIRAVVPPEN